MGLNTYDQLVEAAAERATDTGIVDLVDLSTAAELGFSVETFVSDVQRAAEVPTLFQGYP